MPPIVLALDASADRCSVALWRGGPLAERSGDGRRAHSELLMPFVREILVASGLGLADVDAIAFGAGPGGFTGLRLACGIAQGLAFGAGRPLLAVGSLDALCHASGRARVYACVDARMDEVYCGAFERVAGELREVLPASVCPAGAAPLPPGGGWTGCGSGFAVHAARLAQRLGAAVAEIVAEPPVLAAAVAALAAERLGRGAGGPAQDAAPLYVRDNVALTSAERLARGGRP